MDYRELIEKANRAAIKWKKENPIIGVGKLQVDNMVFCLTKAITELLNRVEIAEKECNELRESMKPNCLQCESMHKNGNYIEAGGFCTSVPAAYCPLIPKLLKKIDEIESRVKKAEKTRNIALKQLRGTCSACINYSYYFYYHNKGKCENCKWSDVFSSISNTGEDNWEWNKFKE